jgi:hypothetical protein
MSANEDSQQAPSSFGGLFMVLLGWAMFGMMIVGNSTLAGLGGEPQSPLADVFRYAPYIIAAAVLLVSIISLRISTYLWVAAGGALNITSSVVSAVSAAGILTLGLLRMYGKV